MTKYIIGKKFWMKTTDSRMYTNVDTTNITTKNDITYYSIPVYIEDIDSDNLYLNTIDKIGPKYISPEYILEIKNNKISNKNITLQKF
jgi:hypothetical protein